MSTLPPSGTSYVIYARYSTNLQSFKSIEDQVRLCREYAARHSWIEAGVYYDAERSGTTLIGRDGFFSMMASADRGEFQLVLVEDLDRLSRSASGTHGMIEEFEALDITVCTVSSGVVTDMEVAFKAAQNARFIKGNVEKVRRGLQGVVLSGRLHGRLAYGYKKLVSEDEVNGRREIIPAEQAVLRRIFADYDAGLSVNDICRALNREGISGPGGRPWRAGALWGNKRTGTGILRNRLYAGENVSNRTETKHNRRAGTFKAKVRSAAERTLVPVDHLALLDRDLFERVQERMRASECEAFQTKRKATYLFSGQIFCGQCGRPYAMLHDKLGCTGRVAGICHNRRRTFRTAVEEAVLDGFRWRLADPDILGPFLAEYRAEAERAAAEQQQELESGATRARELEREIANVMAQVRDGRAQGPAGQLMWDELNRLQGERQRLDLKAKREPRIVPANLEPSAVVDRLQKGLDELRAALDADDRDAVRARDLIRSLVDRIEVTPMPMEKEDGRGIGPVRVTVEGELANLLDFADAGRVIQHRSGPTTMLDHETLVYRFYVDIDWVDSRLVDVVTNDLPILARLLDDADAPVPKRAFVQALMNTGAGAGSKETQLEEWVTKVLHYLKDRGQARSIMCGPGLTGWVWNHRCLTNEEWKARALVPQSQGYQLPIVRVEAPGAYVTIIGPRQSQTDV